MPEEKKWYRYDINGLRALAVILVILFHFRIPGFGAGFIGVDVFFVISGYLMTQIIVKGLQNAHAAGERNERTPYSIYGFYASRARRIAPALIALCAVTLIAGWFYQLPVAYEKQSESTIGALAFFSNIQFWREAGYFDYASYSKPLLHTWSLSVEWQFYLAFPLFLYIAWKLRPQKSTLCFAVALGFLGSLAISVLITPYMPVAAFYLLPPRAWEMFAGGLAYFLANQTSLSPLKKSGLQLTGLLLIAAAALLFDEHTRWPGWQALVPVLGAACILVAAKQNSVWIKPSLVQRIGDWSYSLYLWHWPLVVILFQLDLLGNVQATVIGLASTLLLGWLSYRFIEVPSQRALITKSTKANVLWITLSAIIVIVPCIAIIYKDGVNSRVPDNVVSVLNEATNRNPRLIECFDRITDNCTYGKGKLGAILLGDSHAAALTTSVAKSLPNDNVYMLEWTMSGCIIIRNIQNSFEKRFDCANFVERKLLESASLDRSAPLLIINRTTDYLLGPNEPDRASEVGPARNSINGAYDTRTPEFLDSMSKGITDTACEFAKTRQVFMLRPIPEMKFNVPETMAKELFFNNKYREIFVTLNEYHERNAIAWRAQDEAAKRCGVKILDPLPYLCPDGICRADIKGVPIYSDDDHLNERGAAILLPLFQTMYSNE